MATGNINAIKDWTKNFFYTKDEVCNMFININKGLTAYKLKLIGTPNTQYTIVEDIETNPQSYSIVTNEIGEYTDLFFLHSNSSIIIDNQTIFLSDYSMTIYI